LNRVPRAARDSLKTPGTLLAEAWVGAVALLAALHAVAAVNLVADLACSPVRLLHGEVWTLATSSVVIQGPPVGQLVMTAAFTGWVIARLGAKRFWIVAIGGHIGATVVAYLGIGVLWAVAGDHLEDVVTKPDYGISAVWAALLGALIVVGWRLGGWRRRLAAIAGAGVAVGFAYFVVSDGHLADVEHVLAFAIGIGLAAALTRRTDALDVAVTNRA
jgi:membrane associated rhomboid family serine protease